MTRFRFFAPSTSAAIALTAAALPAQVTVSVTTLQPLALEAQITGDTPQIVIVPAGTDVTSVAPVVVTSTFAGKSGSTAFTADVTTTGLGTTCEIAASGSFVAYPLNLGFVSNISGSHLVTFTSPVTVAGAIVVEPLLDPTSGPGGFSVNTMTCDLGDDGSIDVTLNTPSWMNPGANCLLLAGQPFPVRVTHHHAFQGDSAGDYVASMKVRFIPHAEALGTYGAGCSATLVRHLFEGGTELMIGASAPASDFHLLAFGFTPINTPLPQSTCPLLTSTEVVLGPFAPNWLQLPHAILPPGLTVYLQLYGVHAATGNLHGTRGITMTGQ